MPTGGRSADLMRRRRPGRLCRRSPLDRVLVGSVEARPAIISEKKMPIDSDEPALKNVPRMPEAAPRWCGGHGCS